MTLPTVGNVAVALIASLFAEVRFRLETGGHPELLGAVVNRHGVFRVREAQPKMYIADNRFVITCFPPGRTPINAGAYLPREPHQVNDRAASIIDQLEDQLEWQPLILPAIPVWDGWVLV